MIYPLPLDPADGIRQIRFMRWWAIGLAIALVVLWLVVRFVLAITSAMIHIILVVAVILFILGLIRRVSRRSSTPP